MNEIKTLLFLELRSFYGINKFLHTKDLKYKKRYKSLSIVWILLICMIFSYVGGLVYGLCKLGMSSIVPAYLVVLCSAFIVFFGMFATGNRIFGQKGYDILASMPVKPSSIVISRFLGLYIADFILTIAIILPGIAVYGYCEKPNIFFYIFALFGTIFIPAVPLVIATVFGTAVMAISSRMKNKSMVQSLLSVIVVVVVMGISFSMKNVTAQQFKDLAITISSAIEGIYPPAIWFNFGLINLNFLYMLFFIIVSVLVAVLTVCVVSKNYNAIVRRFLNITAKHNYKIGKIKQKGITKSLYFREVKRYFSSSIYVTNTIMGPILGTVMSIALCIVGLEKIKNSLPFSFNIIGILPFIFSAVFCMMTTTSVSISMEGKQFWVVKSLPISTKALLDSKILLNLSLMLPFYAVSQIALVIATKPTIPQLLWLILIPSSLMLFVTVFGITVNLKFHSFDWEKEETVVKQSLPSALGGFSGFFLSIVLGIIALLVSNKYTNLLNFLISLALWISTALLYNKNNKKNLIEL